MYGATIPEDAEAILSKQAKDQAPGALDEESGGDSQPPHKSYGRIIFAGLALLAFVLIAGDAVPESGFFRPSWATWSPNSAVTIGNDGNLVGSAIAASGAAVKPSLSTAGQCPQCETAYSYCLAHCDSGITDQGRCLNICSIAAESCCDCGN
jgi:hypothetical protein